MLRSLPSSVGSTRPLALPHRWAPRLVRRSGHRLQARRYSIFAAKTVIEPSFVEQDVTPTDNVSEDTPEYDPLTTQQVKALVSTLCQETKIAQMELQLGSFHLKIRRNVGNAHAVPTASPVAPEAQAASKIAPSVVESVEDSFAEEDGMGSLDESLMLIDSPKVGFFRLGVYNKNGKKVGKGPKAGDQVRAGQVLCAIEQLGTYTPILSPQPGEVLAFPLQDGEPVAYKDAVVEFAPYFGGHIIGDKKYA